MKKQPRPRPPTSAARLRTRERERQAMEMRMAGATYEQIGKAIGITHQGAQRMVKAQLARTVQLNAETAQSLREWEAKRLDAMMLGLWEKARRGDEKAVQRVLDIMRRRAELLGLDANGAGLSIDDGGNITINITPYKVPNEGTEPPQTVVAPTP